MTTSQRPLLADLERRLRRGQHLTLYGPRGSGKSTLAADLERRLRARHFPCARAPVTGSLNDITQALVEAYPQVATADVSRRRARGRLLLAADLEPGALLLDHLHEVSTAMIGFLRRLRGGIVGVLLVVDVDVERERDRVRAWRLGALPVRMPRAPASLTRRLLLEQCGELPARIDSRSVRYLVRAARGRPGWILDCASRLHQAQYWRDGHCYASLACTDTELSIRGASR